MGFNTYTIILLLAAFSAFNFGLIHFSYNILQKRLHFLALGAILFSVCLGFYFYEVSGLYERYPNLLWINAPILYLIGPAFYFHLVSKWRWYHLLHLLPFLYFLYILYPFYLLTATEKLAFYQQNYNAANYQPDVRQYLYLFSIGVYCLLGYRRIKKERLRFHLNESNNAFSKIQKKVQILYLALCLTSLFSFFASLFFDYAQQSFYQFDYFILSLITLLILLLQFYFTYEGLNQYYSKAAPDSQNQDKGVAPFIHKNHVQLILELEQLMQKEQLYLKQNLKINDVANALGTSLHELSAAINQHYKINFFNYINKLRVAYLKTALLDPQNDQLTLLAIAKMAGFNSNSSFYRVFKQEVGCTPKAYILANKQKK
ncbi:MAG: helix-turn-helix transcriptional regulator [Chitinophagales bacterium]|nr:helix-turn-helix transcriptional regulator [Chitinophagales bacterium]